MENDTNVLDELYKGCCMGIDALNLILKKCDNYDFNDLLENQKNDYEELANKIDDLYRDYCTDEIHDTSKMDKLMTWYGVSKDTIFDNSTSKLADLLINGTNIGIIEGRKLLNNKNMNKAVKKITSEYVKMQEKYIEKLKKFL